MRYRHVLLWSLCTIGWTPRLATQAAIPPAALEAVAIDSHSSRPISRVVLFGSRVAEQYSRGRYYVAAATTGVLRLDSVAANDPLFFSVQCVQPRPYQSHLLDSMTVTLRSGELRRWLVRGSAADCDQREFIDRVAVFEGLWRSGFEESSFFFCDPSVAVRAWAERAPDATEAPGVRWPKQESEYFFEAFVRAEGRLRGPWGYGHLGASPFELTVSRILEVRRPSGKRCGR